MGLLCTKFFLDKTALYCKQGRDLDMDADMVGEFNRGK